MSRVFLLHKSFFFIKKHKWRAISLVGRSKTGIADPRSLLCVLIGSVACYVSRQAWLNRLSTMLSGVGLVAALMYAFAPAREKRRRARFRDKLVSASDKAANAVSTTARELRNRAVVYMPVGTDERSLLEKCATAGRRPVFRGSLLADHVD